MVIIYVKRVNGSIRRSMEEINLSWPNQMKNDVGGKLISLEARREKVWTVIVLVLLQRFQMNDNPFIYNRY